MPVEAHFDEEEDTLYWKWTGRVTGDDFFRSFQQATEFPGYRPGANIISDFTEADHILSTDTLLKSLDLLGIYKDQFGDSKVAIIVSNLRDYGLATMFSFIARVTPLRAQAFMDPDRARIWLTLPYNKA